VFRLAAVINHEELEGHEGIQSQDMGCGM